VVIVPTVLFLLMFVVIHLLDPTFIGKPLSMSRDGKLAMLGYVIFGLLACIGVGQCAMYWIARRFIEFAVLLLALGMLIFVAVTPTQDGDHTFASLVLLGFIYLFYAIRLYLSSSIWIFAHLLAPIVIVAIAAVKQNYGIVQKAVILYSVLTINLDCWCVLGTVWFPRRQDEEPAMNKKRYRYKLKKKRVQSSDRGPGSA
jgi:hypothetical protein